LAVRLSASTNYSKENWPAVCLRQPDVRSLNVAFGKQPKNKSFLLLFLQKKKRPRFSLSCLATRRPRVSAAAAALPGDPTYHAGCCLNAALSFHAPRPHLACN
jgi:hypothetical protein